MARLTVTTYHQLLTQVKKTLLEGQRRIEQERVRTYWETGRAINTHILKNKDRAEYGAEVVKRLAGDLKINLSVLQRCVQFAKVYPKLPIVAPGRQFSWTHFRKLITINDAKKRLRLQKAAAKEGWTVRELAEQIKSSKPTVPPAKPITLKPPARGEFYTYVAFKPADVFADAKGEVTVDCGFDVWRQIKKSDFPQAKFTKTMSYTYRGYVERVIDGDTLWVHVDLGLGSITRQKIRLRSIDTPELSTAAGQRAKAFLEKLLKGVSTVTLLSSKSDKYDRYLADVWVGEEYLNQKLLDAGLASLWR